MSTSILDLFRQAIARDPAAPCITWQGITSTYGQVDEGARAVAAGLRAWGLQPGERVALAMENSREFVLAYLGAGLAGGVAVPINTQYRAGELRHILTDSGAALALANGPALPEILALRPDLPDFRAVVAVNDTAPDALRWDDINASPIDLPLPAPSSLALLVYTSGTTGRAKGVMLSHTNLAANSLAVTQAWGWTAADRLLLMLPLFHVHGLGVGLHGTLVTGASLDLRPRFEPHVALAALATGEYSLFFGVPTMYSRLLAAAQESDARPRDVRLFVSGSAPLSPTVFEAVQREFGQTILERYGMTETGMLTTNPLAGPRRAGTVGKPFPGQEALVGAPGRPLPAGEVGDVWVRGSNVCQGYWRNPAATAAAFQDGWFNTGDRGFLDEDGVLTLVGRAKELIITGGFNVYPREVEDTLAEHPAVAEAAVFGLPDADLGERVAAAVVLRPDLDPAGQPDADDLAEYCRARLAPYKKPRQVFFVASLPRNAMGKVQKDALRRQFED